MERPGGGADAAGGRGDGGGGCGVIRANSAQDRREEAAGRRFGRGRQQNQIRWKRQLRKGETRRISFGLGHPAEVERGQGGERGGEQAALLIERSRRGGRRRRGATRAQAIDGNERSGHHRTVPGGAVDVLDAPQGVLGPHVRHVGAARGAHLDAHVAVGAVAVHGYLEREGMREGGGGGSGRDDNGALVEEADQTPMTRGRTLTIFPYWPK